jgi:hypothetical protein
MNDKLLIITKLKKTIEYIDKILDNYPHKYIELKQRLINALYDMLELAYLANNDIQRYNNQNICIVKLEMIDYYLKLSYKKDIISRKKFESISNHLLEIKKMLFGWRNYETDK